MKTSDKIHTVTEQYGWAQNRGSGASMFAAFCRYTYINIPIISNITHRVVRIIVCGILFPIRGKIIFIQTVLFRCREYISKIVHGVDKNNKFVLA